MQAGCGIIFTKWAGLYGTIRIVKEKEEELRERFTARFLGQIKGYEEETLNDRERELAAGPGGTPQVYPVGEGGVFAALWYLAKEAGRGFSVDLRRIPVRQETIEICECYRANPYQLHSKGSCLILTEKGEALTELLRAEGIYAETIGHLTGNHGKILRNGGDIRHLGRPAPDELYKVMEVSVQ